MAGKRAKICGLSLILLGIIVSCMLPVQVRNRVKNTAKILPQPEGVELLIEALRDTSGSDCLGAAYYWVYGSNMPLEEVMASYRIALLDAGWEEVEVNKAQLAPQFRERRLGTFRKGEYLLRIDRIDIRQAVLFTGTYRQEATLEARAQEFKALLMITLSYSTCDVWF